MDTHTQPLPADDMLTGAEEIAAYLKKTRRQVTNLLETNRLPAFKLGGRWHMRPSTYLAFVQELEATALKAARHLERRAA